LKSRNNPFADKSFHWGGKRRATPVTIVTTQESLKQAIIAIREELGARLKTQKTAISRIENHAEDIKLSTLDRVAKALGKRLEVNIA
jgi:transcriptional regulator with XRE-family HTH domain